MKYYYSFFFLSFLFISCDKKTQNGLGCYDVVLLTSFESKYYSSDATGDSLNPPFVRYYKDSIRYQIVVANDTSEFFKPEIERKGSLNFYKFYLKFNTNSQNHDLIVHFNSKDKTTLSIKVSDYRFLNPKLFQNDSLITEFVNCSLLGYLKI
jgi:hypothetical protein